MEQGELHQLDADALRKRLVDAERKYYGNLHELQEQLTRLNALQVLSKLLIGYSDPAGALAKLVELSVRDFGVEKAIVLQPSEGGYRVAALRGYSRRRARELADTAFGREEPRIAQIRAGGRGLQQSWLIVKPGVSIVRVTMGHATHFSRSELLLLANRVESEPRRDRRLCPRQRTCRRRSRLSYFLHSIATGKRGASRIPAIEATVMPTGAITEGDEAKRSMAR